MIISASSPIRSSSASGRVRSLLLKRRARALRAFWTVLAALFLVVLAAPAGAFANARVTPGDRAATRAYLQARYAYEQALVASAPASVAAVEGLASSLGGECPGVLAGAAHEPLRTPLESPRRNLSPKQIGESNRESRQRGDLQGELSIALDLRLIEPDRQAALAYARAVGSLRWSNEALTVLEHTGAAGLEWDLQSAPPGVCADMKAWVASGYKMLSPATKKLIGEREAVDRPLLRVLRRLLASFRGPDPMLAYEGPRERALARKIDGLERELESARKSLAGVEVGLERTLGLVSGAETAIHEGPPKGSVEVGHGRTAAGGSYTIRIEPKQSKAHPHPAPLGCQISVELSESETNRNSQGVIRSIGGGSSERCLSRSHPEAPSVQCDNGNGRLTIEAQTLPRARTVRLRLSDGRQITSRVAIVPARLGGPIGFYYQVVRGPSPVPVALTEMDAHGRVLATVRLPRTAKKCVKQSLKLLPGGLRTIASASLPQGPSFSIIGERYSFMGEIHFDLHVEVAAEGVGDAFIGGTGIVAVGGAPKPKARPFALQVKTGCQPQEYTILYGVLKAPKDKVLARSPGGLQPLRRVRIPASLHVHGVLAYIALPAMPSELLVRTPAGKTVFTEKLAGRARELKETCEGEAEGPG